MEIPGNPLLASWNWFAYQCSQFAPLTPVITSIGGVVGGAILAAPNAGMQGILWGIGVAGLTALPTAGNVYWDRKNDAAEDVTAARERVMDEAIPPLLEEACRLSTATKADRTRTRKEAALLVTKDLITAYSGVAGVRAVVYEISADAKRMTVLAKSGRSQQPKPFIRGTARGDRAFAVLSMTENFSFEADISSAPDSWGGTGKGYVTYISAPIRVGNSGYGLLTLDAPRVGDLDSRDGSTVSLLAAALSIYFSEANRTARNVS